MTSYSTDEIALKEALKVAQSHFGLIELRPAQQTAICGWRQGRDLLAVWPTGSGKSLCYQLPALLGEGLTLVVSPLVALMADQVAKAEALGLPFTFINSSLSKEERERRQAKLCDFKLVYVTPERFRKDEFWAALAKVKVTLLAIDEAHCISQWGHDFRPDYSRLGEVKRRLGHPQTMALTATATVKAQEDIAKQLSLKDPLILREGFERPNLFLAVEDIYGEDTKLKWLKEELVRANELVKNGEQGSTIVYFSLIATLQRASQFLQTHKIRHTTYHGDLPDRYRAQNQKDFIGGSTKIILATPAFGLGVDKPDVRKLVHFELPGSIEAYYQEVGRAGRDGLPSVCTLLYEQDDIEKQMEFINWATPEPSYLKAVFEFLRSNKAKLPSMDMDDLREKLSFKNKRDYRLETAMGLLERWDVITWPQRDLARLEILSDLDDSLVDTEAWNLRRKHLQMNLLSLVQWIKSEECRKVMLYRYFSWGNDRPCGHCDNCLEKS